MQISGRTTIRTADEETLSATEWLLDVLFYPTQAKQYKVFLVESAGVMDALNLEYSKPRDRYAYDHLAPSRERLSVLAQEYAAKEEAQRSLIERQILRLTHNLIEFEQLAAYLRFTRQMTPVPENPYLQEVFQGDAPVSFSEVLRAGPGLFQQVIAARKNHGTEGHGEAAMAGLAQFLESVDRSSRTSTSLALFPPAAEEKEWYTVADLLALSLNETQDGATRHKQVASLERLESKKADPAAFAAEVDGLRSELASLATARGEYNKVPLEVTYYKAKFFGMSLFLYVIAFLVAATRWLRPKNRVLGVAAWLALSLPFLVHTAGIVVRCIIRGRPPVTTLYETLVFVSLIVVFVCLCIEWVNRRGVAVSLGASLGTLGLFLAFKYETIEGVDTMPNLIAVLDTNFWLWTHVTTITIGYAAGILAGAIAHIYILGKTFGLRKGDKQFYKTVTRMTYGVLCFGLLFATVGTVLGGIWANDSWGRFWGWDPKENGALLIVLWGLFILHARMGGYIRDFGVNLCSVIGGIVVAFSWFGVNLLGVGLHSYGFTSGIQKALTIFYMVEGAIVLVGIATWLRLRLSRSVEQQRNSLTRTV
jgi:ABC-type transport system involved in cytochrome c biogenesis permease subunit